jgi:hypothetical protein
MAAKTAQASPSTTVAALIKSVGTIVISVFVFGIVIWWSSTGSVLRPR